MSALEVHALTKDFEGLRALDAVTLSVGEGERRVIIGPNGAGKTTFFNLLTGLLRPSSGRILLFGRDITTLSIHQRARLGLGRTFQITSLFPNLTVFRSALLAVQGGDSIRFTAHRPITSYRHLFEQADAALAEWGLADRRTALTRNLSYGEQRQLELVLALARRPRVLLLDEPTAGLSAAETSAVAAMIRRLPRDITVLLIEHDMEVALDLADRVVVLHGGRVLADGETDEVRKNPEVRAIYLGPGHA